MVKLRTEFGYLCNTSCSVPDNIQNILGDLGQELSSLVEEVFSGGQESVVIGSARGLSFAFSRNGEA